MFVQYAYPAIGSRKLNLLSDRIEKCVVKGLHYKEDNYANMTKSTNYKSKTNTNMLLYRTHYTLFILYTIYK